MNQNRIENFIYLFKISNTFIYLFIVSGNYFSDYHFFFLWKILKNKIRRPREIPYT